MLQRARKVVATAALRQQQHGGKLAKFGIVVQPPQPPLLLSSYWVAARSLSSSTIGSAAVGPPPGTVAASPSGANRMVKGGGGGGEGALRGVGSRDMITTKNRIQQVAGFSTSSMSMQSAQELMLPQDEEVVEKATNKNATADAAQNTTTKKSKPKRRTTLETKDPIVLTKAAANRIKQLLQNESNALGIRLGVRRRGCNGLSYTLNYATDDNTDNRKKDLEMTSHGVKIWIDPMALFNVVGTVMDWEETELSSEFTFNNPNSKGECGCGESFNV